MSGLIFVALAVAWAAYLVPKALKHHEESTKARSVERFSHTMRVLARREPVSRRQARLIVTPGRPQQKVEIKASASLEVETVTEIEDGDAVAAPAVVRPSASAVAARRRRRVLGTLLLALVVVGALAAFQVIHPAYVAAPVVFIAAWLVACRLMVRRERAVRRPVSRSAASAPVEEPAADLEIEINTEDDGGPLTEEIAAQPGVWDPVPVTLPTYVAKPQATRRTVDSLDLDATGVWTSGRTEADAHLAREADRADQAARARRADGSKGRAVGS